MMSRKKWRERLHLSGKIVSSLSVLMVTVILMFVMVTTVNCGEEEGTTRNYVYSTNEMPTGQLQQIPSQLSSAMSPQNYVSGNPTSFLQGPANFMPGAQSFMSGPASFFPGAQNFMAGPSSLAQGPQSLMSPSAFMAPGQSFMSGDNPGAAMMSGPAAKMLQSGSQAFMGGGGNKGPANMFMGPLQSFMGASQSKPGDSSPIPGVPGIPGMGKGGDEKNPKDDQGVQYISYNQDSKTKYQSQSIKYDQSNDFSEFKPPPPPGGMIPGMGGGSTEAPAAQEDEGQSKTTTPSGGAEEGETTTMRVIGG